MAPATIDEYLADVPVDKRASLERLRRQITDWVAIALTKPLI